MELPCKKEREMTKKLRRMGEKRKRAEKTSFGPEALTTEFLALATHLKSMVLSTHHVDLATSQFYAATYLILSALLHVSTHDTTRP